MVQYNEMGVHVGDEAIELAFSLRVLAHTSVLILYFDWRKVPLKTNERLWKYILVILEKLLAFYFTLFLSYFIY